jgi:hypothetical protein
MESVGAGHAMLHVEEPGTYADWPGYLVVCSCGWDCRERPCAERTDTVQCWSEHVQCAGATGD